MKQMVNTSVKLVKVSKDINEIEAILNNHVFFDKEKA